jgi:hypothetical protein
MKRLEWEWRLADGDTIRAQLELPSRVETVWRGGRLVSRSAAGGKAEGHTLPLAASGGAYRGASEALVTFDAFGRLASCTLTIDGQVIAPARAPRPLRAFAIAVPSASFVLAGAFFLVRMLIAMSRSHQADTIPSARPVTRPTEMPSSAPPALDTTLAIPDADRVIAGLRPRFRGCYQQGLAKDPSIEGRVVVRAVVTSGAVTHTTIVQNTGLPEPVVECITGVARNALFAGAANGTLDIPVSFLQQKK